MDKKALVNRFIKALKGRRGKAAGGADVVKKLEQLADSGEGEGRTSVGERWSTLIDRASHSVDEPDAMGVLVNNIVGFVRELSTEAA